MPAPRRKAGRPLSFDRETALRQAMHAFWRHGYETTSIADLTTAMGISAPSLYAAFGNKQRLFLDTVQLYAGDPGAIGRAMDAAPTAYAAARDLLIAAATGYTGEMTPPGCLLASATASGSVASAEVQHAVAELRRAVQAHLHARIERDITAGLIPARADAAALSGLVVAVTVGMSGLARDGTDRAALLAIVDAALQGWPSARPDTPA